MNKLYIKNFDGLANEMYENILEGKYDATFIGNYDDSSKLIKSLLRLDDVTPHQISLEPDEWDGYDKEFLISLDEELNVWCEKAYRETGYFTFDSDCMYLADDCNEEVLDHVESDDIWEVSYDLSEDECCDECCGNCICHGDCNDEPTDNTELSESLSEYYNVSRNKDGKVAGFTKSWSTEKDGVTGYSSYSFFGNNETIVKNIAREFGIKID